jgi:hypothetical protein
MTPQVVRNRFKLPFGTGFCSKKLLETSPKPEIPYSFAINHARARMRPVLGSFKTHSTTRPSIGQSRTSPERRLQLLHQRLADTGPKIIGTVHDEIALGVPERIAGEVAVILKETMIHAGKDYLSMVPVSVEVTVADN